MADYSEEELYDTLKNVLHDTKKYLCQVFKRRWREETGTDWKKLSIAEKTSILGNKAFHNANCIESIAQGPGNLEDCELSLLSSAILSFRRVEKYAKENDAVASIQILRESLASKYSGKISKQDYTTETEKVHKSLKCLGIKNKEIFDLISLVKRRKSEYIRINKVVELFEAEEVFKEKRINTNWKQIRDVNAPGENQFQKGLNYTLFLKTGQPEDWVRGERCFREAANKNHVEAITFLAAFHQYGCYGVQKDLDEAKKLFEKAAGMDTKSPGGLTLYNCNLGVAEAQRCLGSLYFNRLLKEDSEKGTDYFQEAGPDRTIHVSADTVNDIEHATFWLQRAMENGNGEAAYQLAILYKKLKLDKNDSMMQMCLKESMNLYYALAFEPLARHYLESMDLDKATYIQKIGLAIRPDIASQDEETNFFLNVATQCIYKKRWEVQVENFESEYDLEIKGLTFRQRLERSLRYSNIVTDNIDDIYEERMYTAYFFRCFGTADFIEGDPMLEIYPYQQLFQLVEEKQELTENDKLQVLDWMYQILIQGPRLVPMRELTGKGIGRILESLRQEEKYKEHGEVDEKLRLCCAAFNFFSHCDETKSIQMLVEGTQRYPDNYSYRTFLCLYIAEKMNWKWGLCTAKEGLILDQKNVELMYFEAVFFSFIYFDTEFDECVTKFENCLRNMLKTDPIYPDACYALSALYVCKLENEMKPNARFRHMDTDLITYYYERGLAAEAVQLDWFVPYRTSNVKFKVGMTYLSCLRDTEKGADILKNIRKLKEEDPVLERKMYLRSPTRKGLIKLHRQNIKDKKADKMADSKVPPCKYVAIDELPKFQQTLSEGLSSLKPITLLEMNPMVENIYKNRLLELTILVEPDFNSGFLASVAEDNDGDVIRVHVYNFQEGENFTEKFSVGSRIAVMNPYLSMTKWDLHSCIRIDDLRCVISQRTVRSMCGFCGEEDSSHACSKCHRIYCSVECKTLDVERHGHNLVCS